MVANNCVPDHPDIREAEQFGLSEVPVAYHCKGCGEDIFMGDWYYIVGKNPYCKECVDKDIAGFEE